MDSADEVPGQHGGDVCGEGQAAAIGGEQNVRAAGSRKSRLEFREPSALSA